MATPGSRSTAVGAPAARGGALHRLYTGTGAFNIVGKRQRWYLAIAVLFLVCAASIGLRGFNLGIDFVGGTQIQMPAASATGPITSDRAQRAVADALGHPADSVQIVGVGNDRSVQIRAQSLTQVQITKVEQTLFNELKPVGADGRPDAQAISDTGISGTWGGEITRQAVIALGVFLVLVTVFLALYFERWMALSALVALVHDVVITAGIYSLIGFEVTPSTVIGLLTILGFSLYDTVVVFDKVRENTRGLLGLTRRTYPEEANLALNQTLMRSINTSLIALLPVLGLLTVGAWLLGVGVLQDLALVQLTGMLSGAISSIFLATPLLVDLKMRDSRYRDQADRVRLRRRNAAAKASGATEGEEDDEAGDEVSGEETLDAAQRRERAMAAAASVPARTGKGPESRRRGSGQRKNRPSGKATRPSGKKRR